MSTDSIYSLSVLVLGSSDSTPFKYSNSAESDTLFKESSKSPIDMTKPDSTFLL
jgi:hypothetical protein